VKPTCWQYQDTLSLNVDDWKNLLSDKDIFNNDAMSMLAFVCKQPNCESSATQIGENLGGVSQQKITALNRKISKKIYKLRNAEPPNNTKGGKRYWNVIFDGCPSAENNELGYFIWRVRPNLIMALHDLDVFPC
jgi:hypothetical protein